MTMINNDLLELLDNTADFNTDNNWLNKFGIFYIN